MTEVKHTPLPWEKSGNTQVFPPERNGREDMADYSTSIYAEMPYTENEHAAFEKRAMQTVVKVYGRSKEEAQATAAFIVRACNSHEGLVSILEKCLKDEMARRKKLKDKSTAACYADKRIEQMVAEIAKAKGAA